MTVAEASHTSARTAATTIPVIVKDHRQVATDVVQLRLAPVGTRPLPTWSPGAHIDVLLAEGMERQYSLCGDPDDPEWTIMVLREKQGRGGSRYMHDEVQVGQQLAVRSPRNHFALEPAQRYRFLAGGIGITPILPMLRAKEAASVEWSLTYCARTRDRLAKAEELLERYGDRVRLHVDAEHGPPDLATFLGRPQPGEMLYACGPAGMLDALQKRGTEWQNGSVRFERFNPVEQESAEDAGFEVELATSGKVLTVPPDRSILDVVRDAGVQVLSSCQEGTCGTCETSVLSGQIDHRDSVLSDEEREEGETMMICVSRAGSPRLVLDL